MPLAVHRATRISTASLHPAHIALFAVLALTAFSIPVNAMQPILSNAGSILYDSHAPTLGTLQSPAHASVGQIEVAYSGITDSGGSGVTAIEFWAKSEPQNFWINTGQSRTSGWGSFFYTATAGMTQVQFALRTRDAVGNVSPKPSGNGSTTTIIDTVNHGKATIWLNGAHASVNQTAMVGVEISSPKAVEEVSFKMTYDTNKLSYVSASLNGNLASGAAIDVDDSTPGMVSVSVALDDQSAIKNGRLADLSFAVLPDAAPTEVIPLHGMSATATVLGESPAPADIHDGAIEVQDLAVPATSTFGIIAMALAIIALAAWRPGARDVSPV